MSIDSLTSVVSRLSDRYSSPPVDTYKTALDSFASDIQAQLKPLSEAIKALAATHSPANPVAASGSQHNPSSLKFNASQGHRPSTSPSRSNRVILFNLPEATLMETKSAIDEISEYLIGKKVNVRNAIHVGRRKPQADEPPLTDEPSPTRLRPIL